MSWSRNCREKSESFIWQFRFLGGILSVILLSGDAHMQLIDTMPISWPAIVSTPGEYLLKGRKVLDSYIRFQMGLGANLTNELKWMENAKLTVRLKAGRRGEYECMVSELPAEASGWISEKLANFRRPSQQAIDRPLTDQEINRKYTREDIAYLASMKIRVPLDNDTTDAYIG